MVSPWLFKQDVMEFDWDEGNSTKILRKHQIALEAAEQLFQNKETLVPLGIQVTPQTNEPRFGVLGMDFMAKPLSVCFTIREGKVRVISIRPMSQPERKKYAALR